MLERQTNPSDQNIKLNFIPFGSFKGPRLSTEPKKQDFCSPSIANEALGHELIDPRTTDVPKMVLLLS